MVLIVIMIIVIIENSDYDNSINGINSDYPLVNKQLDPENHLFLMETNLPTPMTARVYVNLPEGMIIALTVLIVINQWLSLI